MRNQEQQNISTFPDFPKWVSVYFNVSSKGCLKKIAVHAIKINKKKQKHEQTNA